MDTYINCQVISADEAMAEAALDRVEATFIEIDRLTNRFQAESDIAAVNRNAGTAPVVVKDDVYRIVATALNWSEQTGGAFNILIGAAMDLWGFGSKQPRVPETGELAAILPLTDYHQVQMDDAKSTVFLPRQGMVIDLGGIAKGYATDKAVSVLRELGIRDALINAGGNVYALGNRADGTTWKVGIQDPRNPQGIKAVLQAGDAALVSSGDYQRYFEVAGIRYHHILDPATGSPARASAGTTIIMDSATVADVLSTALFVMGPARGIAFAEQLPQVKAALILTEDGGMFGTSNFGSYLADQ